MFLDVFCRDLCQVGAPVTEYSIEGRGSVGQACIWCSPREQRANIVHVVMLTEKNTTQAHLIQVGSLYSEKLNIQALIRAAASVGSRKTKIQESRGA